jgi:ubiquinone/menaquinone biosynthesis C-methylase UbiE
MTESTRHDAWQAGDSYEAYMGRWSRQIATRFLSWLDMPTGLDWLEVGCGTGALSSTILKQCHPKSVIAVDSSSGFLEKARQNVSDARVDFQIGQAEALSLEARCRDVAASALMLNFLPDRVRALSEMRRVTRPGGNSCLLCLGLPGRRCRVHARFLEGGHGP